MYARSIIRLMSVLLVSSLGWLPLTGQAACVDSVVMVHGNTGYPSHFDNTYNLLLQNGYTSSQIKRPSWGSKTCASCNAHTSTNISVVKNAIASALSSSCTGKVDVIGHSMGVTLAAAAVLNGGYAGQVDSFVGIAGGYHGLNSCGTYPNNVQTAACGAQGLSINSPFINSLRGKRIGARMYSIKSTGDEIVCLGGCNVGGSHTSNIDNQNGTSDFNSLKHMELVRNTASTQYNRIK